MRWDNFVATLTGRERPAANLIRARFEIGPGTGAGYIPITPGDEAVALYFSGDGVELHAQPSSNPQALGGWELGDEERSVGHRNYTVRSYDADTREMIVDIAEHSHGPAIDWLRSAEPGWRVLMAGPRSWYAPSANANHHVLAGDLAALPALARILEQTDPQIPVTVIAEVLDASEIAYLPHRANTEIIELIGSGNGASPTQLSATLATLNLTEQTYCWLSGEAADTRAAKKHLRTIGFKRDSYDVVGYWREAAEQWTARFKERGDELLKVFDDALAAGHSADEATDLYEAALEKAGL